MAKKEGSNNLLTIVIIVLVAYFLLNGSITGEVAKGSKIDNIAKQIPSPIPATDGVFFICGPGGGDTGAEPGTYSTIIEIVNTHPTKTATIELKLALGYPSPAFTPGDTSKSKTVTLNPSSALKLDCAQELPKEFEFPGGPIATPFTNGQVLITVKPDVSKFIRVQGTVTATGPGGDLAFGTWLQDAFEWLGI